MTGESNNNLLTSSSHQCTENAQATPSLSHARGTWLQGPEIRTGLLEGDSGKVTYKAGSVGPSHLSILCTFRMCFPMHWQRGQ
jgi:hypothetical protein